MPSRKFWNACLTVLAAVFGIFLFVRLLLPVLLPFLFGLAAALAVQKPADFVCRRLRLPRWLAAGLCMLALLALLGTGLFFLGRTLLRELTDFLRQLPALLTSLSGPLEALKARLYALAGRLPDGLGTGLRAGLDNFFQSGSVLGARAYEWLFHQASAFFSGLPGAVLFAVAAVVSSFMLAAELPALRQLVVQRLPEKVTGKVRAALTRVRSTLGGWLLAQLKLMGVTFLILTTGLMLLCTDYPLLFALLITVVDALPVFGTGTILIPWSLVEFLHGNTRCGVGFLILYAVAALTRQTLEPRLVGKQIGLAPILTLIALYAGYRTLGVAGMVLFPVSAILLKQLWDHSGLQKS